MASSVIGSQFRPFLECTNGLFHALLLQEKDTQIQIGLLAWSRTSLLPGDRFAVGLQCVVGPGLGLEDQSQIVFRPDIVGVELEYRQESGLRLGRAKTAFLTVLEL